MRTFGRWLGRLTMLALVVVVAAYIYLVISPPTLLRVGGGYASKIICSSDFLQGRDPERVLKTDVQAPGNPLLRLMVVETDRAKRLVHAAFLRLIGPMEAVARPGLGCAVAPDGDAARAADQAAPPAPGPAESTAPWPQGSGGAAAQHPKLAAVLADDALAGPGMRAIVVIEDGRLVAERYARGFDAKTPLLGWSMTKSVTAALVGTVVGAGKLRVDQDDLMPQWQGDGRAKITVGDLLSMSSGLHFNEDYGDVSDVTRMLFLEPDMARFVADQKLDHPPGTVFNYSTGTAVLLSRIWQNALGDPKLALDWPRKALFGPVGMGSAVLETDEVGTFVGGSYLYATARDWARFGQLLLQGGAWNGQQVVPKDFVQMMRTSSVADPVYTRGMLWLDGPESDMDVGNDQSEYGLPIGTFWLEGHDGQTVTVIPSAGMVVVRMGLTPGREHYRPQRLVAALLKAAGRP
ncbi:serine hydrolase domain-containing protein [Acidimangrovimonas sediminis]|uniref:serine hydrolase domain-containing protein n=1 Tax=Acidimangrovimonas sediminis TaxID=2056283 RepID=UPI000C803232|nr:serine hydrolase [Acidimangrovimonas sediminis]